MLIKEIRIVSNITGNILFSCFIEHENDEIIIDNIDELELPKHNWNNLDELVKFFTSNEKFVILISEIDTSEFSSCCDFLKALNFDITKNILS